MSGENDKSMKWDRRRQARKAPQSFTFLQLERDEGGRVVNLSEEGLCFESFSPIRTANPVPLWFSFNLRDRIEATGEVVWTDSRKEVGGVAFINLSPAARLQIRSHLAEIPAAEPVPRNGSSNGQKTYPAFVPSAPSASEFAPPGVSASPDQAPLVPLERFVAATRSQFLRGLLLGILITAIVSVFAVKLALRQQPSTSGREASAPSSAVDNPASAPDPSTTKPAPNSSPASVQPADPSNAPSEKPVSDSFGNTAPPSAPASSNATTHPKLNLTPDQLWAEVQSGNSKAAIALADLYLRGDGVPVNCAQARILFQFAAQKNDPEAIKKSRDLEKSGCPTP